MRASLIFCALILVLGLCSEGQAQCPPFSTATKSAGWTPPKTAVEPGTQVEHRCAIYTCDETGVWSGRGCATYSCTNQIGYQDYDYTKAFPLCCPKPICGPKY